MSDEMLTEPEKTIKVSFLNSQHNDEIVDTFLPSTGRLSERKTFLVQAIGSLALEITFKRKRGREKGKEIKNERKEKRKKVSKEAFIVQVTVTATCLNRYDALTTFVSCA